LADEAFAHKAQSRVWAELRGHISVAGMSYQARRIVDSNDLILSLVNKGDNVLIQHLKGIYGDLPLRSVNLNLDPGYARYVIPFKGQ
jgi:hypothetical protein